MVKIFNSQTGKKEKLVPLDGEKIRMYICGMTVYDDTHIGHARTFLCFDLIVRYLRNSGYKVNYIRNITDVDDKIINRAKELNVDATELTDKYIASMQEDFNDLGMISPDLEPRATDNIESIISLIEGLIDKGHAYIGNKDVYFSTDSFKEYGKLSNRNTEDLIAGVRIDIDEEKKNPADFVLWKQAEEGLAWDSPWGRGRPGWHIECSAMSMDTLGNNFDIHGGGIDLKFPHHENEIAQSVCATGERFAKCWMHTGPLRIDKEKMSKSLDNFITIKEALKEFPVEVIRFFLISNHYRSPLNYSEEGVLEAKSALDRLYTSLIDLDLRKEKHSNDADLVSPFKEAMEDDFNVPSALAALFEIVKSINLAKENGNIKEANVLGTTLVHLSEPLGILQQKTEDYFQIGATLSNEEIQSMIDERNQAREDKDFKLSDKIRDSLLEKGIVLEDTDKGTTWKVQ
ncbi:MAG: cysteine--tRNA ligase [Gammaproteobacteria bacterium]